jgi:putative ABC transport system permease protein
LLLYLQTLGKEKEVKQEMRKDYFLLAYRNIIKRGLRSWLTMIGIFIGIAAVVALIGLGEGLRTAITAQFGILGTDVLSVRASGIDFAGPPGFATPNPLKDTLVDKLENVQGVEAAINRFLDSAIVEFDDIQSIEFIASVPMDDKRKVFEDMINLQVEDGRLLKDGDSKRIVLGNSFKKEDNPFKKALAVGDRISIDKDVFEVVGILEKKGSFIIDSTIFMNEDTLLDKIRENDEDVNIIAVKVRDEKTINQVAASIERLLRKERNVKEGEEDFIVQSPQAALKSLDSTLFAVQMFVVIIAVISLLVGGIGIMNTMYTSVVERTKEIGIMKAIGARNSAIFSLFFIESGLLGSVGGAIGVIMGLFFAYGSAAIGRAILGNQLIQAKVSIPLILGALAFSFIMGTVFGSLPAYQASKLKPIDSIRKLT